MPVTYDDLQKLTDIYGKDAPLSDLTKLGFTEEEIIQFSQRHVRRATRGRSRQQLTSWFLPGMLLGWW